MHFKNLILSYIMKVAQMIMGDKNPIQATWASSVNVVLDKNARLAFTIGKNMLIWLKF